MTEDTKEKRRRSMWVSIAAIAAVTILESIALLKGMNGTMFGGAMLVIGGAAGVSLRNFNLKAVLKNLLK